MHGNKQAGGNKGDCSPPDWFKKKLEKAHIREFDKMHRARIKADLKKKEPNLKPRELNKEANEKFNEFKELPEYRKHLCELYDKAGKIGKRAESMGVKELVDLVPFAGDIAVGIADVEQLKEQSEEPVAGPSIPDKSSDDDPSECKDLGDKKKSNEGYCERDRPRGEDAPGKTQLKTSLTPRPLKTFAM